jgi:excisionase family DNA binding protein
LDAHHGPGSFDSLPTLLTVKDVAAAIRSTRTAVYAMVSRGQIPGVIRIGRRVLFHPDDLLRWLDQNRAPSPKE